ncbi:hypothetical protein [Geomesophilobacter sediminis]|uniref:DNA-binding protein n=1 Tax=Geomesophilobacter sediminis TaxID=2798584 RepID=A0A8J7M0H3_9BACT|nr:hypothetical protein [Geomesophilobacter sediminis]MBJ6725187.1 hypothetical protein [Geomesophilobacter sediminis]
MRKHLVMALAFGLLTASIALAAETPAKPGPYLQKPAAQAPAAQKPAAQEPAPTVHSIGEIYAKSAELMKKKVVVRGRVVKVTSGINGKTWTHLQDGTGDKAKGTNDLICISTQRGAEIGDIVSVLGTVVEAGSRYRVVIEDANFLP